MRNSKYVYKVYSAYVGTDRQWKDIKLIRECKNLKDVGRLLNMSSSQVSYLFNGQNKTGWFGKYGGANMIIRENI
jgi:hypothetical protein